MNISWSTFHEAYSETSVKTYVPTSAGVYLLWVKLTNGKWRCFYAGQAKNLETRLLEHLGKDEENECIRKHVADHICGFEYASVALQKDRDGIEKFLYDHYEPECNQVDPGGEPIEVNLP
jgi:excinuclease UvrABC nuclease subunit